MDNLIGLVVCGSQKSEKRTNDRSLFNYHGEPQRYYLYDMLQSLCEKVFISGNEQQVAEIPKEYNTIVDDKEFAETGEMISLLTAFKKFPKANFLVIGCEFPFINRHHLKKLVIADLDTIPAIAYYDKDKEQFEPMIAMYHGSIKTIVRKNAKAGDHSLNNVLKEVDAYAINAKSPDIIRGVRTLKEYKEVAEEFSKFR